MQLGVPMTGGHRAQSPGQPDPCVLLGPAKQRTCAEFKTCHLALQQLSRAPVQTPA